MLAFIHFRYNGIVNLLYLFITRHWIATCLDDHDLLNLNIIPENGCINVCVNLYKRSWMILSHMVLGKTWKNSSFHGDHMCIKYIYVSQSWNLHNVLFIYIFIYLHVYILMRSHLFAVLFLSYEVYVRLDFNTTFALR